MRLATAALATLASAVASGIGTAGAQETIRVRNHHTLPYAGAVELAVQLPDGAYAGPGGAAATVRGGVARVVVRLPAGGEVVLRRGAAAVPDAGPLAVTPSAAALALSWRGASLGALGIGLAVLPGTTATTDDAVRTFAALPLAWRDSAGALRADTTVDGWALAVTAVPHGAGSLDVRARLARVAPATGPSYVALVRRVTTPGATGARLRFNGRTFDGAASPDSWDRDFWYVKGVDWLAWRPSRRPGQAPVRMVAVNGFTPTPTVQRKDSTFGEGSHFWVWERTRPAADGAVLVSEIAGPNAEQVKSSYMPVTPYAPVRQGDAVELRWRLAASDPDDVADSAWAESQLRGFASYRRATTSGGRATIDLGVPSVAFGTSYFPYSTLPENFDYLRTPGLDREVWWAFSAKMWAQWRAFAPRMRTDLHIVRAMGFSFVRLHHLELLQQMPRAEALAFLDFYFAESRALGLRVLIDTEGPDEWIRTVVGRYRHDIARVEVENEVLLYGVKPSDVARLDRESRVAKAAAPSADVFLTSAGNNGVFERLRQLGVPFDRVGLHAYKHGPQWMEAYGSHVLGTADYAASIGKVVTLGEFNWKSFGRVHDEARAPLVRQLYETVLAPRAIPELFEFHFSETQSINTLLARDGTRHYEPLRLDRRPKPEARELMAVIRGHSAPDAAVRALPVTVAEARLASGRATARYTVTNATARAVTVRLTALAFDGLTARLDRPSVRLQPGATHAGTVTLSLAAGAPSGTYHHFVRADYGAGVAYGWGLAAKAGAPTFAAAPQIGDHVTYPQGAGVVDSLDWTRPLAVAYADSAAVLELESANTLANTLQAATGRPVWLSSVRDLPDSLVARGTLVVVGAAARAARLGIADAPAAVTPPPGKVYTTAAAPGVVALRRTADGRRWLLAGGPTPAATLAAASDVVLRFWPNAKDAAARVTGLEKGAALGRRAGTNVNADLP